MDLFDRNMKLVVYSNGQKLEFKDLHIDFEVLLNNSSEPNQAKFQIKNLSEKTRNLFESEEYQVVEFFAGYGKADPAAIFTGEMFNSYSFKSGNTWETLVFAGDGQKSLETETFNKSYSAGSPLETIINDIASKLGLSSNIDLLATMGKLNKRGIALNGKCKALLDRLSEQYSFDWSVLFGVLEITVEGNPPATDQIAVVINADSGLIGSPTITFEKAKVEKKGKPTYTKFIEFSSLLNNQIKPNRLVKIESGFAPITFPGVLEEHIPSKNPNGVYRVDSTTFRGSNYGSEYFVNVRAGLQ
jgi:hypothetical protein